VTLVEGPVARAGCLEVGRESVTVTGRQPVPEEGGAQALALRDRVNSGQRQKPVLERRVQLSHLPGHGMEVAEDLIAATLGYQLPERCFIRLDTGGQPQGDRSEVLKYVRRAVIERPPPYASAICGQ
jgi:hypothetical protein